MLAVCVSSLSQNTATSTSARAPHPSRSLAGEVDLLVEPFSDPIVACVGNEVRKAADVFVVARLQPITPDHFHGALLAPIREEPKEEPRRVVVAFTRALVERAVDRQLDVPAPGERRIVGEIDIDGAGQHRRAVVGFEPHARDPVLDREGHRHRRPRPEFRCRQPEGSGLTARTEGCRVLPFATPPRKSRKTHQTYAADRITLFCRRFRVQISTMVYGYARVSIDGQSVAAQVAALKKAGAGKVYREVASAAKINQARLRRLIDQLDAGDVLMVTRLDRLARSTRDLLNTLAAITGRKAGFRSLGDAWADTTTRHGRLMLTVLGGLAEFERDLRRARTSEGQGRAKARV